jgi:methylenetetrahydrofolate--tRNA-(uracil-5-)-methyltransferase
MRLKAMPRLRFAGQVTGVEGYVESAAIGLVTGRLAAAERKGEALDPPPPTTALGALVAHITGGHLTAEDDSSGSRSFQPMNVNYGLFPLIEAPKGENGKRLKGKEKSIARKQAMSHRALAELAVWLDDDERLRKSA